MFHDIGGEKIITFCLKKKTLHNIGGDKKKTTILLFYEEVTEKVFLLLSDFMTYEVSCHIVVLLTIMKLC